MGKKSKRVRIGTGERCPKCRSTMTRVRHPDGTPLKAGQFTQWDVCNCGRVQHYEAFRVPADGVQPTVAGRLPGPKRPPRDPVAVALKIAEHTGNVHLGPGGPCKRCKGPTERFAHQAGWRPPADQRRYARYWDRCLPCEKITWRPEAEVEMFDDVLADPHTRDQAAVLEHFRSI